MNQYDLSLSNLIGKLPINVLPMVIYSISLIILLLPVDYIINGYMIT